MGQIVHIQHQASEAELAAVLQRLGWLIADCEIDPHQLAAVLGIDAVELFKLDARRPPHKSLESAIRCFIDLMDYASLVFGTREDAGLWLRSANPILVGQRSPMDLLMSSPGMLREIRGMLKEQCELANLLPMTI